ncbi:MAG: guanylate kinase [Spirochaetota bacterium]
MGKCIVVTAPSGSGKTTLIKRLLSETPSIQFSVSHTTRPKRDGETDGRDYHFTAESDFLAMIARGEFLEWAQVHSGYYGTALSELAKVETTNLILDIDVQGAMTLRARKQEALYVFIRPPSLAVLRERLTARHSDKPEEIDLRMWNAKREMEYIEHFDVVIVNDVLERAYAEFSGAIRHYLGEAGI